MKLRPVTGNHGNNSGTRSENYKPRNPLNRLGLSMQKSRRFGSSGGIVRKAIASYLVTRLPKPIA
jgi:hypothetical protein